MNAIKLIAAALTLACAAPAIAADYLPYIKQNVITKPSAEAPTLKEVGLTNGVFYMVKANDDSETRAAIFTEATPTAKPGEVAQHWDVSCGRDRMTDQRLCEMSMGDFGLVYDGDALTSSMVAITAQVDGTGIETRVGKHKMMRTFPTDGHTLSDQQAQAVIAGLLAKETVLIRYTAPVSNVMTLREVKPAGFEEAANYMMWRFHHM